MSSKRSHTTPKKAGIVIKRFKFIFAENEVTESKYRKMWHFHLISVANHVQSSLIHKFKDCSIALRSSN